MGTGGRVAVKEQTLELMLEVDEARLVQHLEVRIYGSKGISRYIYYFIKMSLFNRSVRPT